MWLLLLLVSIFCTIRNFKEQKGLKKKGCFISYNLAIYHFSIGSFAGNPDKNNKLFFTLKNPLPSTSQPQRSPLNYFSFHFCYIFANGFYPATIFFHLYSFSKALFSLLRNYLPAQHHTARKHIQSQSIFSQLVHYHLEWLNKFDITNWHLRTMLIETHLIR